jgi:tRNA threonylcarbamoyl adenosine modification protein YeaZ
MKILALEFSSSQRSVAVVSRNAQQAAATAVAEVVEIGGSAAKPFEMIAAALRQAGIEREQIECVTVGLGPGSYNGIRSAIAIAQGWQLAAETKLLGISTVDCLIEQAREDGLIGKLNVVIDAQRTEFYLAVFDIASASGIARAIEPLRIVDRKTIEAAAGSGEQVIGPEVAKWFATGRNVIPRAAVLGRLALTRSDFVSGDRLEPIYLRETNFVKAPAARKFPHAEGGSE